MRTRIGVGGISTCCGAKELLGGSHIFLRIFLLMVFLLTGGCSAFKDKSAAINLERQIARQQVAREMATGEKIVQKRTAAEYEEIGDRYLLRRDINRAYLYYLRGLEVEPERISLLEKQAALLLTKHKFFEAEIVYKKLLTMNSASEEALEGLGKALFNQKKYAPAEESFRAVLAISNKRWSSFEHLGLIASHHQNFPQARVWFNKALQLQPDNETLINNLAVSHYLNGDYAEALRLFNKLAKVSDERKVHNNLALTYFRLGHYDKAMASFKRGSKSEAEAYNNLGYQYLVSKQFLKAIEAFERAIDLNPRYYIEAEKNLALAKNGYAGYADADDKL